MANVILKLMTIFSTDVGVSQIEYSNVDILAEVIDLFMSEHGNKIRKNFKNPKSHASCFAFCLHKGQIPSSCMSL